MRGDKKKQRNVTPAFAAAQLNHLECLKLLHTFGATLNTKDNMGNSITVIINVEAVPIPCHDRVIAS